MSALSAPPKAYWQCERWSRYANDLVRYYARRSDFSVRLSPTIPTACVIPSRKQVVINPEWVRTPRERLSRVQVHGHDRLKLTLEGLAAHEAGHIRFSGSWPGGLLGQLVNALEDERIERLQREEFDITRALVFLGDHTLLGAEQNEDFFSARAGVLLWRFQHDFPHDIWHTDDSHWEQVKPLVEGAWAASTTAEVIALARRIMEILDLDEDSPEESFFADAGANDAGEAVPEPAEEDELGSDQPGTGAGQPPRAPEDQEDAFDALGERLSLAFPLARQLERILNTPQLVQRALSRSRGRLKVRRVIRNEARPFERKVTREEQPRRIIVVQDISYSMGLFRPECAHYHALLTALALELACSRQNIKFALISFDDDATLERPFSMPRNDALLKVASLAARGDTVLCGALERTLALAQAGDVIFVLCDGQLTEQDVTKSRMLAKRTQGMFIPILIGESAEPEQFREVFGRCYDAAAVEDIPTVVKRALLAARAS